MSNFYTPRLGLQPETREQMLMRIYERLRTEGIFSEDYNTFLGTNWHRFLSDSVLPAIEEQQALFFEGQAALFSFWQEHFMAVQGGFGSSYEGFYQLFSPYCVGVNLVTIEHDMTLERPGNVALYFDNLVLHNDLEKLDTLRGLFRRAMPLAIFTPRGDTAIIVDFTGANAKTYHYFNLEPENYTKLDLRITVEYKMGAITYSDAVISQSVREQFDATNRIGRGFYPESYFDHALLPNIASMQIEHKLSGTGEYYNENREADFGQKFIIDVITIVQASRGVEASYD